MAELAFANPKYLFLLILVPFMVAIHFFAIKRSRGFVIKFSNFEAIERVASGDVLGFNIRGILQNKNIGLLLLRAVVYCLLILSASGTSLLYKSSASVFDYVIAIDASTSMQADDFTPSRFEAAREAAKKFVDAVPPGAEIGIVTFSTSPIPELNPASKKEKVIEILQGLKLHEGGGTAIGDAVITSANMFKKKNPKAVVVLTDGQSNAGLHPAIAADYAIQNDIIVHSIGVATKEGGSLSGLNVVSKLDEELLKELSEATGGKSFIASSEESLEDAFKQIALSTEKMIPFDMTWILLIAAISLLGMEWIFINTIYKTIP